MGNFNKNADRNGRIGCKSSTKAITYHESIEVLLKYLVKTAIARTEKIQYNRDV